jgi:hypothetical protein
LSGILSELEKTYMILSHRAAIVALASFTAVFGAACKNKSETPTSPSCTLSVAQPATPTFGPEGGSGSVAVSVTAGTGCTWTATSSASFLTISAGSSGSGAGTVQFTIAANTGAERTGTLTVAGTAITITQRAAVVVTPPTLSAPTARSPVGGQAVDSIRPALVVNNAASTGSIGTVTYRFEIALVDTFPADSKTLLIQEGVAQGSGTTTFGTSRDMPGGTLLYWHARATNGTITTAYSATETFRTPVVCSYALSSTSVAAPAAGGPASVAVTTTTGCAWTAASNASFITVVGGSSGTGNGTVTLNVDANTGAERTGTVTIAGTTVTVTQAAASAGPNLVASFNLIDPGSQAGPTTECRIKSATSSQTTCVLQSTSFTFGRNTIVSYAWSVRYAYDTGRAIDQTSSSPTLSFTDLCGLPGSSDDGASQPLEVTLTVTDNNGETATATAGAGSQPALRVRLFTCGI